MDLHAQPYTFKMLFASKKVFSIPRYQREFSWGRPELYEMYSDVVKRLTIKENKIETTEYFFGNVILEGDMADSNIKELSIIDGQQRFTAITIFLAALAKKFGEKGEDGLKAGINQYIMGIDDNNNPYAVFVNKTPHPFFQFKIQGMDPSVEPKTDEEIRINYAYEFFCKSLNERKLLNDLSYLSIEKIDYIDALKAIRDQLLGSYVICCWTKSSEYANLVFEIMNAKGLELASIDLIKNYIFSVLDDTSPADYALEKWKNINANLMDRNARIPFPIFFRHYWNSIYGKVSDKKLFTDFKKKVSGKDNCKELLIDMVKMSNIYNKCLKPQLGDYENKNQYLNLVESLVEINDTLNVSMPRIFIMNLMDKYLSGIINTKTYEKTLQFIEKYHYIYNGVCSDRTNKLEATYCNRASELKKCNSLQECNNVIEKFKSEMLENLPSFDIFYSNLINCKYSSKVKYPSNVLCKYFVMFLEKKSANIKNKRLDSSVEHILNENESDEVTLTLPYLISLQRDENSRIPNDCAIIDKYKYYLVSTYSYAKEVGDLLKNCKTIDEVKNELLKQFENNAKDFYDSLK